MLAKTRVTEVQVYRKSAVVIRNGEVELKSGRNVIFVHGMTKSAVADSFRLKFPEKIRAINIQIVDADAMGKGEVRESEQAEKKVAELQFQIDTANFMLDTWKANSVFTGRSGVTMEEQERVMEALPGRIMELHRQIEQLTEEKDKLQEQVELLLKEEEKPLIMAELYSEEEGKFPFVLQYQDNESGWVPKYEIQYLREDMPLDVRMKAQIRQTSGEDWKQVKVTLYTGNPSVSGDLPEIQTVELSLYEPPKPRARTMAGKMAPLEEMVEDGCADMSDMMMGASAAGAAAVSMLKMDTAEVAEEETMTAYILPNLRDILSDTDGNIADLQIFSVKADTYVLAVPGVDNHVYLAAEVLVADWPLPPAFASVYLRDTLAGEAYVDAGTDTEKFTISLGQDERITVVRTEAPKKTQDAFLKNARKQQNKVNIRLVNSSSDVVCVLLRDQLPVSTDKAIVVEPEQLSGGEVDQETGVIEWKLKLEKDKAASVDLEYTVSWPKDKQLNERRKPATGGKKWCRVCGARVYGRYCPNCGAAAR